jgi:hypothetical protein
MIRAGSRSFLRTKAARLNAKRSDPARAINPDEAGFARMILNGNALGCGGVFAGNGFVSIWGMVGKKSK